MTGTRIALGTSGVLLASYGAFRILTQQNAHQILTLGKWLVAAVVLHDFVLVPLTMLVGAALGVAVRPRARRYLQGALITGGLVTVISLPLIYRRGSQAPVKALERQNYGAHLALLWAIIAAVAVVAYLVALVRGREMRSSTANERPSIDHDSEAT